MMLPSMAPLLPLPKHALAIRRKNAHFFFLTAHTAVSELHPVPQAIKEFSHRTYSTSTLTPQHACFMYQLVPRCRLRHQIVVTNFDAKIPVAASNGFNTGYSK